MITYSVISSSFSFYFNLQLNLLPRIIQLTYSRILIQILWGRNYLLKFISIKTNKIRVQKHRKCFRTDLFMANGICLWPRAIVHCSQPLHAIGDHDISDVRAAHHHSLLTMCTIQLPIMTSTMCEQHLVSIQRCGCGSCSCHPQWWGRVFGTLEILHIAHNTQCTLAKEVYKFISTVIVSSRLYSTNWWKMLD